jgi:hypothetical protein
LTIKGRNLYEGIINFRPTQKTVLRTNHKPKIRGTDLGIWRRIHYVPYQLAGGLRAPPIVVSAIKEYRREMDRTGALRPHQRHPWHALLCQLGALACLRTGLAAPPPDAEGWRTALRALTPDFPDDDPWMQGPLEPRARREKALTHETDLVLDLALFPARGRRAGHWLDEIMPAHLKEAAIVLPVLAGEDCLHRGLHVVVNAALAGAFEKGKGAVMRVEHHLLGLARIGANKRHAAWQSRICAAFTVTVAPFSTTTS